MATSPDLSSPMLLLAMPQVLDPFFHHSVVLLIHHEDEGSLGFIVNRPTGIRVREILQGMEVTWKGPERSVAYFGGPVQPQVGTVLYTPRDSSEEGSSVVVPGLSLTQHVGDLAELVTEILRNDWLTAPVSSDLIFAPDPEEVWADALRSVGVDPAALPSWTAGGGEETTN
jgi:putative transcriptional regulator